MPKSQRSMDSVVPGEDSDNDAYPPSNEGSPTTPFPPRRLYSSRIFEGEARSRRASRNQADEQSSLLGNEDGARSYKSVPPSGFATPRATFTRQTSQLGMSSVRFPRHIGSSATFSQRLVNALTSQRVDNLADSKHSLWYDDRVWYDQYTTTDWVHDSIADAYRVKALRSRKDIRGRLEAWFDGAQGWILVALIGCLTAFIAYVVNVTETALFDLKFGYCSTKWYISKKICCIGASQCDAWNTWSDVISGTQLDNIGVDFIIFIAFAVGLALISCLITLTTKTVIPSAVSLSTLDENLGAEDRRVDRDSSGRKRSLSPTRAYTENQARPPMVYYSAAGSGVAEVRVILSGFVLHGYLGVQTLTLKTAALILSVASGLSLGKEGPYVHIATCIGNVACRLFSKYNRNDGKRREVLSASAASGVAVAFGAPVSGVLFSLEEVSYYFPPKTLFRTFFCCIAAALTLKFLNPYGTNKIVLFEVRYLTDWKAFEMVAFVFVGVLGGAMGAMFIKASRVWARTFRRIGIIKNWPMLEVFLVALLTGIVSFWNRYTKLPVTELLFELASPCATFSDSGTSLCPVKEEIPSVIGYLAIAFVIKAVLTIITFGIKVPAGIYVPSMVVGGLMGRIVGHTVQYLALSYSHTGLFGTCSPDDNPETCVVPGVYALVAAGATMCGVTRLSVTLAVILFELTGSLDHVLPFSIGVLVSKWVSDALEPLSIYDLLTDMNSYPFLDNKVRPIFTDSLAALVSRPREERTIDISASPLVPARELRRKLEYLHMSGELDGGLPILRDGILVGLIPAPDLEFALDRLENEENSLCLMSTQVGWAGRAATELDGFWSDARGGLEDGEVAEEDPTDLTLYIDPAPISLDIHSPMDLVYECFVKLGLRYICVLKDGKYASLVHKKAFVKYTRELEENT